MPQIIWICPRGHPVVVRNRNWPKLTFRNCLYGKASEERLKELLILQCFQGFININDVLFFFLYVTFTFSTMFQNNWDLDVWWDKKVSSHALIFFYKPWQINCLLRLLLSFWILRNQINRITIKFKLKKLIKSLQSRLQLSFFFLERKSYIITIVVVVGVLRNVWVMF